MIARQNTMIYGASKSEIYISGLFCFLKEIFVEYFLIFHVGKMWENVIQCAKLYNIGKNSSK